MQMSKLFGQTLRDTPAEAEIASHQLLLRAGYIRQLAAGIFSYLPLAKRSLTKIENIMRSEINAIGGQEVAMPVVHPAEPWQETGRWYQIGSEMGRFKDKSGRDMVLAMTHEEIVAELVRKEVRSYRQMPLLIYHIQTKWRDDPRPRGGLVRAREFTMKDSYSLDSSYTGLEQQYRNHYQAYFNIFRRCGLPVMAVKADVGMMGGQTAHEFMYLTPSGEDTLLFCDTCGYAANRQVARFQKPQPPAESQLPIEKVATPGAASIADLSAFLQIPAAKTAKAVFMVGKFRQEQENVEKFIFAIVRGDTEVNETKLANALKALELRPATEEEIRCVGAVPGYASPVGLQKALVIVDEWVAISPNLAAGANIEGYHLRNVNLGRDYQAEIIADITAARAGDQCPQCGALLRAERGVEVGNIFMLGTRYSEAMGCYYQNEQGEQKPVLMGSYGIGSGRLLACIAEQNRDEKGLIWPITVAPFQVHLVMLAGKSHNPAYSVTETALQLYEKLHNAGIETLLDDRNESPGVKFNDADLMGMPIRITVSERALMQGGVEFKRRDQPERKVLPLDNVIALVQAEIKTLAAKINQGIQPESLGDL